MLRVLGSDLLLSPFSSIFFYHPFDVPPDDCSSGSLEYVLVQMKCIVWRLDGWELGTVPSGFENHGQSLGEA